MSNKCRCEKYRYLVYLIIGNTSSCAAHEDIIDTSQPVVFYVVMKYSVRDPCFFYPVKKKVLSCICTMGIIQNIKKPLLLIRRFEEENLYRHRRGYKYVRKMKTVLMEQLIIAAIMNFYKG